MAISYDRSNVCKWRASDTLTESVFTQVYGILTYLAPGNEGELCGFCEVRESYRIMSALKTKKPVELIDFEVRDRRL